MKRTCLGLVCLVVFVIFTCSTGSTQYASVQAADDALVYFVHGLPGLDVGGLASLPIDIFINDELLIENMTFGKVIGPVKITPGNLKIQMFSSGTGPNVTSFDPLAEGAFKLKKLENASIVGHLTSDGDVAINKFGIDSSEVLNNKCRFIVHHCMTGPPAYLGIYNAVPSQDYLPDIRSLAFENGDKFVCEIEKKYKWYMEAAYWDTSISLYNKPVKVKPKKAALVYLVGSRDTGTVRVITKYTKKLK